jgi:hypothetical protein
MRGGCDGIAPSNGINYIETGRLIEIVSMKLETLEAIID